LKSILLVNWFAAALPVGLIVMSLTVGPVMVKHTGLCLVRWYSMADFHVFELQYYGGGFNRGGLESILVCLHCSCLWSEELAATKCEGY
jgi:hypothetical protein